MIGHINTGGSFFDLLRYLLEDKKALSEQDKKRLSDTDHLQHSGRAEVLEYNLCYGNKNELTRQFKDVSRLSRRVEKPVLHMALRLAPGEQLTRGQLMEMGRACAKAFGVADHQYICVLHKDTKEQHIHIAANRVGFDGRVASDSQSYKRMSALCRELEKKFGLTQVLSPRKFLPKEQRGLPRFDSRKEKLKTDIRDTLQKVGSYTAFEQHMKGLGYQVLKGRGISFIDDKKVKIKGSEVGFSLVKIERLLSLKQQLQTRRKAVMGTSFERPEQRASPRFDPVEKNLQRMIDILLKPEHGAEGYVDPELMRVKKKKRRALGL